MATFISKSPEQTIALGEAWGRKAQRGWLIGLRGDLGAGKTQLVKGLARGLSITEPVRSPTFALINQYAGGRLPLVHLDFYRLDTPEQILAAGLEEYLTHPAGVTVAEWIERWTSRWEEGKSEVRSPKSEAQASAALADILPPGYRDVWLECLSETERRITYEDFGT